MKVVAWLKDKIEKVRIFIVQKVDEIRGMKLQLVANTNEFNATYQTNFNGTVYIDKYNNGPPGTQNHENTSSKKESTVHQNALLKVTFIAIPLVMMITLTVIAVLNDPQTSNTLLDFWSKIYSVLLNAMLYL